MTDLFYSFVTFAGLFATLAAISICAPRPLWIKISALGVTTLCLPAAYVSLADLLSRPKPVALEWSRPNLSEAVVLGSNLREGESIYLWLKVASLEEPRSYVLPWNQKVAEQLYGAQREANSKGTVVRMKTVVMAGRADEDRMFYAVPQSPLPPKDPPVNQALVYTPSMRDQGHRGNTH